MGFELMQKQIFLCNSVSSYVYYKFLHGTESPPFLPHLYIYIYIYIYMGAYGFYWHQRRKKKMSNSKCGEKVMLLNGSTSKKYRTISWNCLCYNHKELSFILVFQRRFNYIKIRRFCQSHVIGCDIIVIIVYWLINIISTYVFILFLY